MSSNDRKEGDKRQTGFAGLSDMASDVDAIVNEARQDDEAGISGSETSGVEPKDEPNSEPTANSAHEDKQSVYQQPTAHPSSGNSGKKWIIGIAVVVGFFWMIGQSSNKVTSPSKTYQPSVQPPPSPPSVSVQPAPAPSPPVARTAPTEPWESKPPVGTDQVFSLPQIRYCMAEKIRIEAARANTENNTDVDRFNGMVNSFNSRCQNYRYYGTDLETAQADVEQRRVSLEAQGRKRFPASVSNHVKTPEEVESAFTTQKHEPRSRTDEPGLEDLSNSERESIESACDYDKAINGPAAYRRCLSSKLAALRSVGRMPDLSQLSSVERESIESACDYDKAMNGPAAYHQCLSTKLAALRSVGRTPDLSDLASVERESIESACDYDKAMNGPAAYNRCLLNKLAALRSLGRKPDVSRLNWSDRESIESTCDYDKTMNGPAAYYKCLSMELSKLGYR